MEVDFQYPSPWCRLFAKELRRRAAKAELRVGHSHAQEICAAAGGYKSYAAFLTTERDFSAPSQGIDVELAEARIAKLCPNSDDWERAALLDLLTDVVDDGSVPVNALAWRLAEYVDEGCTFYSDQDFYVGSVLLTEADWDACCEILASPDFRDGCYRISPWPSIAAFSNATPDQSYGGRYQVEPDSVLNVLAFIAPDDWDLLLGLD